MFFEKFHKAIGSAGAAIFHDASVGIGIEEGRVSFDVYALDFFRLFLGLYHIDTNGFAVDSEVTVAHELFEIGFDFLAVGAPVGIVHDEGASRVGGIGARIALEALDTSSTKVGVDKNKSNCCEGHNCDEGIFHFW